MPAEPPARRCSQRFERAVDYLPCAAATTFFT